MISSHNGSLLVVFLDKLYESVGLQLHSALLKLDPNTGETLETHSMESKYFGEGLTYAHGKLYQLTYKAGKGFIYDIENLGAKPEEFSFQTSTGEGKSRFALFNPYGVFIVNLTIGTGA